MYICFNDPTILCYKEKSPKIVINHTGVVNIAPIKCNEFQMFVSDFKRNECLSENV